MRTERYDSFEALKKILLANHIPLTDRSWQALQQLEMERPKMISTTIDLVGNLVSHVIGCTKRTTKYAIIDQINHVDL